MPDIYSDPIYSSKLSSISSSTKKTRKGNKIFLVRLLYINAAYNKAAAIKVTDDIIYIIIDNLGLLSAHIFPSVFYRGVVYSDG